MSHNFAFPTLKAYFELVKAFQRSLIPSTGSLFSTFHQPVNLQDFKFATGVSQNSTLSAAVVECVNQVQQRLGHNVHPNFCQLLVTDEPYGEHLSLAARYVQEIFGSYGLKPPNLIGGAVEGLLGGIAAAQQRSPMGQQSSQRPHTGVSLMAAVLPGVTVHPFHAEGTALPDLPWDQLLQVGLPGPQEGHRAAAILLSEPHFTQVPELLSRVQSAMPGMSIVGGVLKPNAWGRKFSRQASMRGALFIGGEAVDSGAVGCILTGPLQVDSICAPGCRPVGRHFTVTRVEKHGHHNLVLELDHQPAHLALAEEQKERLSPRDKLLQLQVGVDTERGGFLQVSPRPGPRSSIDMGMLAVREGSRLQLHVLDPAWAQREMQSLLQKFAGALPAEVKCSPSSLGALLYSCAAVAHDEPSVLQTALQVQLPDLAFQGAKVQGEIGHVSTGAPLRDPGSILLRSYCSSFSFMRRDMATARRPAKEEYRRTPVD